MQKNNPTMFRKSLLDVVVEIPSKNQELHPKKTLIRWQDKEEMFPKAGERLVGLLHDGSMVEIMRSMHDGFYFYAYTDSNTWDSCAGYKPARGEKLKEIFAIHGMDIDTIEEWQVHKADEPTKYNPRIDESEYKRLYSGEIQ